MEPVRGGSLASLKEEEEQQVEEEKKEEEVVDKEVKEDFAAEIEKLTKG